MIGFRPAKLSNRIPPDGGRIARWRNVARRCELLAQGHRGEQLKVLRLDNSPHDAARLRDLGLREGVSLTVLSAGHPLLVRVGDARIGISRSAAMKVQCEVEKEACSR